MKATRKRYTGKFKAKVVLEATRLTALRGWIRSNNLEPFRFGPTTTPLATNISIASLARVQDVRKYVFIDVSLGAQLQSGQAAMAEAFTELHKQSDAGTRSHAEGLAVGAAARMGNHLATRQAAQRTPALRQITAPAAP